MFPPILPGGRRRSGEQAKDWEKRQENLSRGYRGSPWLTALVTFSGFLLAIAGSMAALFTIANLHRGTTWVPYAIILAALACVHLSLRALRYLRRRSRPPDALGGRRADPHRI